MNVYSISSIYIPRMAEYHNKLNIMSILARFSIGHVNDVDFTPINQKPGFEENIGGNFKSAFIHFIDSFGCLNGFAREENAADIHGNFEFWRTIASGQPYRIQVNPDEYWICLINKNPVQRTMMNIHQVVENGRHLENIIYEQNKKIRELEEKLRAQHQSINNIHQVVYQLVGGLFCHENQGNILNYHLDILFGNSNNNINNNNPNNIWGFYPTTRQGDDCEKRLDALEQAIFGDHFEAQNTELFSRNRSNSNDTIPSNIIEDDMDSVS